MSQLTRRRPSNVMLEDAHVLFKNFAGREGQYNREGDRNFVLVLPEDLAVQMTKDGWNVKRFKEKYEDREPDYYVEVAVGYGRIPPKVVLISSGPEPGTQVRNDLPEELVGILDEVEWEKCDVIVRPYSWEVSGKTGIKAYLNKIFVTLLEDELDRKYAHIPRVDAPPAAPAIESGDPRNVIEGSVVYDEEERELE
jgi:hypothetical protein